MRQAPAFWWEPNPGPLARLLAPAGRLYGAVTTSRMRRTGSRLTAPVLCVGNLVAGGAGKTPTAIALARMLQAAGHSPAFVSRGYGGKGSRTDSAVIAVDPQRHRADQTGDEPLLLARVAPTYVSGDRRAAGERAIAAGASVLILDDGLQNPNPHKDVSLAVVDGRTGSGNGLCIPAGPLRAPVAAQLALVSALCIIGDGESGSRVAAHAADRGLPVWTARLLADPSTVERLKGRALYAFAGIGRPSKFFATLAAAGLAVAETRPFPDHHRFSGAELSDLQAAAQRRGATLVTTEKDRVRLPPEFPAESLPVRLTFDDYVAVADWVLRGLNPERSP